MSQVQWDKYECAEYVERFAKGYLDVDSMCPIVYDQSDVHEITEAQFLAIGSAGADGIEFGYR